MRDRGLNNGRMKYRADLRVRLTLTLRAKMEARHDASAHGASSLQSCQYRSADGGEM